MIVSRWKKWMLKDSVPWLLLLLSLVYFFTAKGLVEISDTDYSLKTAQALIENQTFLIDPPDPAVAASAPKVIDGKIYSKYGVGLVLIFLPIVLVAKGLAVLPGLQEVHVTGFLVSFYNIPFALGALYFLYRICRQMEASRRSAGLVILGMGVGTFFWKYTVTDYSEVTQVFFLLGTIYFLFRSKDQDMVKASIFFSGLLLMKLVNVLLWGPLAIYVILRFGLGKPGLLKLSRFASVVFLTGVALLLYNYLRFGSPLSTGYESEGPMFSLTNFRRDFLDFFFSPQRGLFFFNPVLLLAIPFWPAFFRKFPKEALCLLLMVTMWFCLMASWASYQGGWAWGNRLLIITIPLVLLPLALNPLRKPWQLALFSGLLLVSVYIQMVAVFQHTHEYFVILRDMGADEDVAEYLGGMPPQLEGNAVLFHQKLAGKSGEYPYHVFLGDTLPASLGNKTISTIQYDSYQGLHVWPFHLATFLRQPMLRWLLLGILPCLALIFFQMYKLAWHPERMGSADRHILD